MKGIEIIEGALDKLYFFLIFLLTVGRIRIFFSLKPSSFQGESSLKISAHQGSPFWRSQGTNNQTNNQTDSLTDWRFYRVILYLTACKKSFTDCIYICQEYYCSAIVGYHLQNVVCVIVDLIIFAVTISNFTFISEPLKKSWKKIMTLNHVQGRI